MEGCREPPRTSNDDATTELFLRAVYSGPLLLSHFSPVSLCFRADLSQPLYRLWSPIPECHVDIAHRLKHTQATHDHSRSRAITIKGVVYHRERSLSGSRRAAAGAILKARLHAALYTHQLDSRERQSRRTVIIPPVWCLDNRLTWLEMPPTSVVLNCGSRP